MVFSILKTPQREKTVIELSPVILICYIVIPIPAPLSLIISSQDKHDN